MTSKTNKIKKAAAGILAAAVVAVGVSAQYGGGLMPEMGITAYAASTTVTWNNDDITGTGGKSFTKDGVTITAGQIDFAYKCFLGGGTFTTTLGNFTKIEVTADEIDASGTGWSGNNSKKTWTGNSSSVSFRDNFYGFGSGVKFVFTIELPTVPATATYEQVGAYDAQFDGDTAASLWRVNVTAGTDSITSLDVKLGEYGSKEGAYTPTITDGHVVLGVVTNLTAAEVKGLGGFTVLANGDEIQTDAVAAD